MVLAIAAAIALAGLALAMAWLFLGTLTGTAIAIGGCTGHKIWMAVFFERAAPLLTAPLLIAVLAMEKAFRRSDRRTMRKYAACTADAVSAGPMGWMKSHSGFFQ
jgi:hypothetical protein